MLLTPVILTTVRAVRVRAAPHVYAATHLSNSASLLLPVSNLTNLLAFQASGLTFLSFAGLMAGPWAVCLGVEYAIFRVFFRIDLRLGEGGRAGAPAADVPATPRTALALLGAILLGFAVGPVVGIEPVAVAVAGAVVMAVRALLRRSVAPVALVRELNPLFLVFVAALGVVVDAATSHGLQDALAAALRGGTSLLALLALAAAAAVLAVLIGVNVGPNLTYTGSLATLLWRRVLHDRGHRPSLARFTRLGLLVVPACVLLATIALWLVLPLADAHGQRTAQTRGDAAARRETLAA